MSTTTNKMRFLSVILSLLMLISVISFPSLKVNADGSAGTLDDFVERCYTVTLDRPSDADGFADWKGQLLNGKAVGFEIAYGFLFSKEYLAKDKDNDAYLKDLYMLFMGREPDEGGYNDWMGKLNGGASRLEVFAGFANSPEFYNLCKGYGITAGRYTVGYDRETNNNVNLYVERMYKICLDRIGDKDGQKNWVGKLITKQISGSECARSFIFSKEYENKGLSDEEFVENLYLAMFGRPSDEAGKAGWLEALDNGQTRDQVFAGFANSAEFDNMCRAYGIDKGSYTATHVCPYKVGDIIKFGKYEQDNNLSNGKEDIEWQVLDVKKGKVYVVSRYILDRKDYHTGSELVTWETCELREWLNNDFYNTAFSDAEKNLIPSVTIENMDNPFYGYDGGNDTTDKVFLLSLDDVETYFGSYILYEDEYGLGRNQNIICEPTEYAIAQGVMYWPLVGYEYDWCMEYGFTSDIYGKNACDWWLRTIGGDGDCALFAGATGRTGPGECSLYDYGTIGVRPAMYISY